VQRFWGEFGAIEREDLKVVTIYPDLATPQDSLNQGGRVMKLAITSDMHLGDPECALVSPGASGGLVIGDYYDAFKNAAGTDNDYLILVGDVLDFSVATYEETYAAAKMFFQMIKNNNIAREIIYVSGNHDFDIWHTVEYEVNVVRKIAAQKIPEGFRWSVPGVLDDRNERPDRRLILPHVTPKSGANGPRYGGLFLDKMTIPDTTFNFVYPNLYFITRSSESVLITHGQYFDAFWSILGEWALKLARQDLGLGDVVDLREMVAINFPFSQLSCSGVGQAGPLTRNVVRPVQREVKDGDTTRVRKYLDRLDNELDALFKFPWHKQHLELLTDLISNKLKEQVIAKIEESKRARGNDKYVDESRQRIWNFYSASRWEINDLNGAQYGCGIPLPQYIIYGHTHTPFLRKVGERCIINTGTWIKRLYRTPSRLRLVPDVYAPSYRLNCFTISEKDGNVRIGYEVIHKAPPRDLTILERLMILGRHGPEGSSIPAETLIKKKGSVGE
jgi:predicted phosphodiesterase